MAVWFFPAVALFVCISAVALIHRRESIAEMFKRVRKMTKYVLAISVACFIGVVVLTSTLSFTADFFYSVLSPEFIGEIRETLKALFGTESVFASLNILVALSILLFSFAACAFCVCGAGIYLMRTALQMQDSVDEYKEQVESLPDNTCVRRYALLSRYLI
ncbi:MAG: hypothetical protein ACI4MN_02350 [Candidatus Coproplasma sp.]